MNKYINVEIGNVAVCSYFLTKVWAMSIGLILVFTIEQLMAELLDWGVWAWKYSEKDFVGSSSLYTNGLMKRASRETWPSLLLYFIFVTVTTGIQQEHYEEEITYFHTQNALLEHSTSIHALEHSWMFQNVILYDDLFHEWIESWAQKVNRIKKSINK